MTAEHKNTLLRPIVEGDLEVLRKFRNETKSLYLRKIDYITSGAQKAWFKKEQESKNSYAFAIVETETLKRTVGSCALYNINDDKAEFGRMLIGDKEAHGRGIGFLATLLCLHIGFEKLMLKTITANVHEENIAAVKSYLKAGFVIYGKKLYERGGFELEIGVTKESKDWGGLNEHN